MAPTATSNAPTTRTDLLIDHITNEVLSMTDNDALAATVAVGEAMEKLGRVFLVPTNMDELEYGPTETDHPARVIATRLLEQGTDGSWCFHDGILRGPRHLTLQVPAPPAFVYPLDHLTKHVMTLLEEITSDMATELDAG